MSDDQPLGREVSVRIRTRIDPWLVVYGFVIIIFSVSWVINAYMADSGCHMRKPGVLINLETIARLAKSHFAETGRFPTGHTQPMPPWSCCPEKCDIPAQAWAADPIWAALGFATSKPTWYQYRYDSADGVTFRVTAVGDPQCDGRTREWVLEGSTDHAQPQTMIIEPPP